MPVIDNRTPNRNYQLPNSANNISDDVARLIAQAGSIDTDIGGLFASMSGKVDTSSLSNYIAVVQKNIANGVAGLNSNSQIDIAQLPPGIIGGMRFQNTWNAATNIPAIPAASAGNKDFYWIVSNPGNTNIGGITDWQSGDWLVSTGTGFGKIDNTDGVQSVAGRTGAIVIGESDVTNLVADLAGKAPSVHAHVQSDVTGLNAALATKAGLGYNQYSEGQAVYKLGGADNVVVNTTTPGVSGAISRWLNYGYTSTGVQKLFNYIQCNINVATAGAEDSAFYFTNLCAGISAQTLAIARGLIVGPPAGGDMGVGTINAKNYFKDGVSISNRVTSANYTVTFGSFVIIPHNFGAIPYNTQVFLKCINAASGYVVGEMLPMGGMNAPNTSFGITISLDNINLLVSVGANGIGIVSRGGGSVAAITAAHWNFVAMFSN